MPFRKAKSIELHEAHTIITLSDESYAFSSPTARNEQANRPAFHIRLADVNRIAKMLGYNPQQRTREILDRSGRPVEMGDIKLPVMREYFEVPSDDPGVQILALECDVLGPNLVEIRLEFAPGEYPSGYAQYCRNDHAQRHIYHLVGPGKTCHRRTAFCPGGSASQNFSRT